jgi:hypothetical protein
VTLEQAAESLFVSGAREREEIGGRINVFLSGGVVGHL